MFDYFKEDTLIRIATYFILITIIICSFIGNQIIAMRREIQTAKGFIEAGEYVQQNFEENLKSYQKAHKQTMQLLQTVRPLEEEIIPFINSLEKIGRKAGLEVSIKNLEPKKEDETEKSNFIKYNISSYGTEEQLLKYLEELEKLPYYLKIDSLSYLKRESETIKKGDPSNVNFVLKLYIK